MLAGLLWPDYAESSALTSLRTALAMLRAALCDQEAPAPCLLIDRETVRLNPQGDHVVDTAALDAIPMDRLTSASTATLQEAADLYRGEFLEGFSLDDCPAFEEWLSAEREHYRRRTIQILHCLAERRLGDGAHQAAEACARRGLALDPPDEETHRRIIRALALGGQRAEALLAYEACAKRLADELGIAPSAETTQLFESIRAGALGERPAPAPVAAAPPPAPAGFSSLHQLPPPPADFVGRAGELRDLLHAVQRDGARLLAIRGEGGMGKTSLGPAVAAQLEAHYPSPPLHVLRPPPPRPSAADATCFLPLPQTPICRQPLCRL